MIEGTNNVLRVTQANIRESLAIGLDPEAMAAELKRRILNKGKKKKGHVLIEKALAEHGTLLDTIASDSDAMSGHDVHMTTYQDVADRLEELDRELWGRCLVGANGRRWEAYYIMDCYEGMTRKRIAAAAGCKNVNSVTQGISKYRRGIAPDLSFVGK